MTKADYVECGWVSTKYDLVMTPTQPQHGSAVDKIWLQMESTV